MKTPQKFRELVFQLLYSIDLGNSREELLIPLMMKELSTTKKNVRDALNRINLFKENQKKIDQLIKDTVTSYDFDRITSVEKNILRLGIFELFYDPDIPEKVAISEGIRLAKKFGTPESAAFINAILDQIFKQNG